MSLFNDELVIIRGAGDLATGVVYSLYKAHFKIILLETQYPSSIRRKVALSEAVYDGKSRVEDIEAVLVKSYEEALNIVTDTNYSKIPILIDPNCEILNHVKPTFLIDAIIAKKNLGTNKSMAKYTIALGPGFTAGKDVDIVIETVRGHNLGRMYTKGEAIPNTGIPGNIGGKEAERVIHASADGIIENIKNIGDFVREKEVIAYINNNNEKIEVLAAFDGLLRGIIRDGFKGIIPEETKVNSIKLENGILTIDFSKELLNVEKGKEEKMIEAIVYSLLEIKEIKKISILVEGEKLSYLPNTSEKLPKFLDKSYGVNKIYNFDSIKDTSKTTIYYLSKYNDYYYYVPVTKISNETTEKAEIIIKELKSTPIYHTNLISYLAASTNLTNYELLENSISLSFDNHLLANLHDEDMLEEVKYSIALSLRDSYGIEKVLFNYPDSEEEVMAFN